MRNKIILVFLFSLLIPIHFSSAIYTPSIGTQSNPLHIQVEQDPTQLWQAAWDKINSMQYVVACSSKYNSVKELATKNGFGNITDPYTAKSTATYLNYLYSSYQLCVTNAAQMQNQYIAPQPQKAPTVNILDSVCQNGSGINSFYSGETDVSKGGGMAGCSCKLGFQFEHGNYGQCVTIPAKSNNQICQDKYGLNSIWNGTLNDKGGLVCDCNNGYQWNTFKTQCNLTPIQKTVSSGGGGGGPTATVATPKVEKTPEINITKEDVKENTPNVAKLEPVSTETNVVDSTSEVKHTSLWAKIKGWLGF